MNRYWFGLLIFLVMAGVSVATFAQQAARLGSVQHALEKSFLRYSLVYAMFGVMGALICAARILSGAKGNWRFVPLVLINIVIQPLCGFAVVMGSFKVIMALTGRATYGFQIMPRE